MIPQLPQICLAPLRGLTGVIFRDTYARFFHGIDWAVTPFLTTVQGVRIKPSQIAEVLPENNRRMPAVPQIISKTAANFVALATALHDLGYDTVNWNLGCPFARVARKQRGSGLLPYPDRIDAFLDAVLGTVPTRMNIKLRLGRHQPEEILALMPVFNRYPLHCLIIHPRTGVQMYNGRPDLEIFAQCLARSRAPVIYNGDIVDLEGFQALRQRFPAVMAWMIGRGVLADPFLPEQIKGAVIGPAERRSRFTDFHAALFDRFAEVRHGPSQLLDTMKGYWNYFAEGVTDAEGLRQLKRLRKAKTVAQYREIVETLFYPG